MIAPSNPKYCPNLYEVISPIDKLPKTYPICWKRACKNDDSSGFLSSLIPKASVLISCAETHKVTINNNKAVYICLLLSSTIVEISIITHDVKVMDVTIQNFLLPQGKYEYFSINGAKDNRQKLPVINLKLKGSVAAEK